MLTVALLVMFASSVVGQSHTEMPDNGVMNASLIENPAASGMQIIVLVWVFTLGACFGSFLNVVIYRLPAGMSLGHPKSRCPRCEAPLAARDNIPVLGWILLRGKCRYCSLPISVRYPVIEAVCGGIFLLLLFAELFTGAANLPLRIPDHFHVSSRMWLVWFTKWDLIGIYLYHCAMLILVLAIAMIGYDGHRPHRGLFRFSILVAIGFGMLWLELRPVRALPWSAWWYQFLWGPDGADSWRRIGSGDWCGISLIGLLDGLLGWLGGVLAGRILLLQMNQNLQQVLAIRGHLHPPAPLAAAATILQVVGAFLGWQACLMLSFIVMPMFAINLLLSNREIVHRLGTVAMFVAVTLFTVLWRPLNTAVWFPGIGGYQFFDYALWLNVALTLGVLVGFAVIVRLLFHPHPHFGKFEDSVEKQ